MADDDAIILRAATDGRSIRDIATERGMSEAAVTAILDRQAASWLDGAHLRRELLFEVKRLEALARLGSTTTRLWAARATPMLARFT